MENEKDHNFSVSLWWLLFSLFKITEICFGSTKMGILYREKAFHAGRGKKSGKMTLPPLKNIPLTPLSSNMMPKLRMSFDEFRKKK